jgi:hypothetical protein
MRSNFFMPKKNDPFNAEACKNAYTECQQYLAAVINELHTELQELEIDYQAALRQNETRRLRWLGRKINVVKERLNKLEYSLQQGQALLESMAISMGLENHHLKTELKLTRTEARLYRVYKAYLEELVIKYEQLLKK